MMFIEKLTRISEPGNFQERKILKVSWDNDNAKMYLHKECGSHQSSRLWGEALHLVENIFLDSRQFRDPRQFSRDPRHLVLT